jgi:hypothetical protein
MMNTNQINESYHHKLSPFVSLYICTKFLCFFLCVYIHFYQFFFPPLLLENFNSWGNKRGFATMASKGRMGSNKPSFGTCSSFMYTQTCITQVHKNNWLKWKQIYSAVMCMQSKCACLVFSTVHMQVGACQIIEAFWKTCNLGMSLFIYAVFWSYATKDYGRLRPSSVLFFESVA